MDEFFKETIIFLKTNWPRKSAFVVLILFTSIVLLISFSAIKVDEVSVVEISIGIGTLFVATLFWLFSNRIPKAPKGKIGFALGIVFDNPEQQQILTRDFADTLRNLLFRSKYKHSFAFIEIPAHFVQKIQSPDIAIKTLKDTRCTFMVYGKARTITLKGQVQHVLNLEGLVAHKPISSEISKSFSGEFADLFPRRLIISSEGDLFSFEFTANWLEAVSKYIIGISALLSGDIEYAQELFEDLQQILSKTKTDLPAMTKIRERLPSRLKDIYLIRLRNYYEEWKRTKDIELINKMGPFLECLTKVAPSNYDASVFRSMWYFIAARDIAKAKSECIKTKNKQNITWRYNYAFLFAYEGDMERALKEYKLAFRGYIQDPSFIFEIVEFILWMLEAEPDKSQLYFCLGLIYYHVIGDPALALQDLEKFLETTRSTQFLSQRDEAEKIISKIQKDIRSGKIKLEYQI